MQTAEDLIAARNGKPRQSNLRRAVSAAYYALFHCLARCCADLLVGGAGADRSKPAWKQVYRALDHGLAKNNCKNQETIKKFPKEIEDFANMFVALQTKRHMADYDPDARFYKSEVRQDVAEAADVMDRFKDVPLKDRRAFAAYVLFKSRP